MVGFTLVEPDDDRQSVHSVDRHSIASTVATTTSLASRIRDLNLFECGGAEDKDGDEGKDAEHRAGVSTLPEDSEEEREPSAAAAEDGRAGGGPLSEEELSLPHSLHLLQRDPPLQVCCQLFERRSHPPLPLKRMSMVQVEDFRQHGYVVIDNFISREAAARIKAEAMRLNQRGLMQPVSAGNMGVLSTLATNIMQQLRSVPPGFGSSPCSSCSSHSHHIAACSSSSHSHHIAACSSSSASNGTSQQQLQNDVQQQGPASTPQQPQQQQQQQRSCSELRMPLVLGHPPADTAVFAPVMAALQEIQEDLSEFVRLRSKGGAEYCLCQLPPNSLPVPRHRDALPDDGRSSCSGAQQQPAAANGHSSSQAPVQQQHMQGHVQQNGTAGVQPLPVAAAVVEDGNSSSSNAGSQHDAAAQQPSQQSPVQQLQLPQHLQQQQQQQRRVSLFVFVNPDWDREGGGGLRLWPPQRPVGPLSATAASSAARRSPTSSDAGTTFSEISDCGSLRLPPFMGSTTSSVIAEASAPDHDTYSLDGISVAESEAERQGFEWVECEGGEMALDIAPLSGRVLLVLSGAVEHALLPSCGQGQAAEMVYVRAWCC